MSRLKNLKSASSLHDLGQILGYSAKGLAYVIHGVPDAAKYTEFQILKRSGGMRTINAPIAELKRLQKHLAHLLNECIVESDAGRGVTNTLSHGFRPNHSIMTNALQHRKKRYVFNIDLHDFFGTINFGRVWKYLEINRAFALNPTIARTIAQIACHNRTLPQGSPCSPVISNLIAHILDIKMVQLAARARCHYSRYADDLTFSTNEREFPSLIADRISDTTEWTVGSALAREITRCGFQINSSKTRMQFKSRRQDVTGIIVNSKINIRSEYSRNVRAMVNSLVTNGEFSISKSFRDENGVFQKVTNTGTDAQLRGMLSFIDCVRLFEQKYREKIPPDGHVPRVDVKSMPAHLRLYRQFLMFTQFYRPTLPLLICEGKTDNVYIRCALNALAANHQKLVQKNGTAFNPLINFYSYTKTTDRILHLKGGTGDLSTFIANYGNEFCRFEYPSKRNPVIILVDNDSGSTPIFSAIKKATESKTAIDGNEAFYAIRDNLYVVAIPKIGTKETPIEHYFKKTVLNTKLGGKSFSGTDKFDSTKEYGKHLFAEHVIKKNRNTIDFSRFDSILKRIEKVIEFHAAKPL